MITTDEQLRERAKQAFESVWPKTVLTEPMLSSIVQALQQVRRETVDEVCTFLLTPCVGSCPADALPSREAVAELIEKKFGGRP